VQVLPLFDISSSHFFDNFISKSILLKNSLVILVGFLKIYFAPTLSIRKLPTRTPTSKNVRNFRKSPASPDANPPPPQNVPAGYMYRNLNVARDLLAQVGGDIATKGLPAALAPLTFVFTSTGNVSQVWAFSL
jgi:hypothetical protein